MRRIWGNLNGTVTGKGLGVAFYKILGGAGLECLDARASQAIVLPSLLSAQTSFQRNGKKICILVWGAGGGAGGLGVGAGMEPASLQGRRWDPGETWACACRMLGLHRAWPLGKARKVSLCPAGQVLRAPSGEELGLSSEQVRILTCPNSLDPSATLL